MTSYTSEIVVGSAIIVAALGVAAYMVVQPQHQLSPEPGPVQQAASALHAKAWGKPWPQFEGTIYKTDIFDDGTGSVDDEIPDLADKLNVPSHFNYRYFKGIQRLKNDLGANSDQEDIEGVLVIREEYEMLRRALEGDIEHYRAMAVTGHPGIGSYESWFSSLESNADFSSILREEHLPPLPSFISSREQTSNGSPI